MKKIAVLLFLLFLFLTFSSVMSPATAADELRFVNAAYGGALYRAYPAGGEEKDSILFLELSGSPYSRGLQHGALLADRIADVISNRYSCITPETLAWMEELYWKLPTEWREEVRGLNDALVAKGYNFPLGKVVMHATQPIVPASFPWFICPWNEAGEPTGSFSYAVWGRYVSGGGSLAIGSPDWGAVPKSLTRNRVIFSVRPDSGYRHVFLGVAGTIGLTGMNETGVATAGTTGQRGVNIKTPMPGNGIPIPDGFLTLFLVSRQVLQYYSGSDPLLFERFETEILAKNPVDGFITQLSAPGRSAVWEPGAIASPEYPYNSRRSAGEWDNNQILPVDIRGDLILAQSGVYRTGDVNYSVRYNDSRGAPYSGTVEIDGRPVEWRVWQLGRAFVLPKDANRASNFAQWTAAEGSLASRPTFLPASEAGNPIRPNGIVSVKPDRSGGFWVTDDGKTWGIWRREGDFSFRAFSSDGAELCSGPLYDFGAGVAGWCSLGDSDIEWVAWSYQFPDGAYERLDGMNLSVLPAVKPWALVRNGVLEFSPHPRTHFVLKNVGAPAGRLSLNGIYNVFQKGYLSASSADAPFGVGAYDLVNLEAMFTTSRYDDGGRYIGGLNPELKPIWLNRFQLFGY